MHDLRPIFSPGHSTTYTGHLGKEDAKPRFPGAKWGPKRVIFMDFRPKMTHFGVRVLFGPGPNNSMGGTRDHPPWGYTRPPSMGSRNGSFGPEMAQKWLIWSENGSEMAQKWLKIAQNWSQKWLKIAQNWSRNGPEMVQKLLKIGPEMVQKLLKIGPEMAQNGTRNGSKWHQNGTRNGSKWHQKWLKMSPLGGPVHP